VPQILWDQVGNPEPWVARRLGIETWQLRAAIHKIKAYSHLGGADRITIWDNGDVSDDNEVIGNIYDEI
jgi:hypothetical protein